MYIIKMIPVLYQFGVRDVPEKKDRIWRLSVLIFWLFMAVLFLVIGIYHFSLGEEGFVRALGDIGSTVIFAGVGLLKLIIYAVREEDWVLDSIIINQDSYQKKTPGGKYVRPIELAVTCEAAPTQIEGTAYGHYIYFRERGGYWTFEVGPDTNPDLTYTSREAEGECPEFMGPDDAMQLTRALINIHVKRYVL